MTAAGYLRCLGGIVRREALRWVQQRGRFVSALVRPLVWLVIFAAGFHFVLGVSITPPYETYIPYEVYIAPGLVAMIQLFNGMQSSLSMVYDREMGSMKTLMVSPFPRWFLLTAKLLAGVAVSVVQAYLFLLIAWFWDIQPPITGYLAVLPALVLSGLMLGALGLVLSSFIRQLENFAGVMNFVIFPMFFTSSALYPLWRVKASSLTLYWFCQANPFTHAAELIRFALYDRLEPISALIVVGYLLLFMGLAVYGYDPGRGLIARRAGAVASFLLLAVVLGAAGPPPTDPDWPCMQRLVPTLSVGTYWTGPPADTDWHADPRIVSLVEAVTQPGVATEQGEASLAAYADSLSSADRRRLLPALFAGIVDATNRQRSAMLSRLDEMNRRQRGVARVVDRLSAELQAIPPGGTGPDGVSRDDVARQRDLVARMFQEAQGTMRYACQAPVDLEARLGGYARVLQAKLAP